MGGKDECPDKNHAESHRDPGEFGTPVPHSALLVPKQEERTVPHQKKSTYRPDQAQDEGHDGNGQPAGPFDPTGDRVGSMMVRTSRITATSANGANVRRKERTGPIIIQGLNDCV